MKRLIKYSRFIFEQNLKPNPSDSETSLSKKNRLEDLTKWIKEFNTQKNQIKQIYMDKSLDEKARKEKLKPFLKSSNTVDLEFNNDLLRIWSESCSLLRKIDDLSELLKKDNLDLKDETLTSKSGDDDTKKRSIENVNLLKTKIDNRSVELEELKKQFLLKEKDKNTKIKDYEEELKKIRNEIIYQN
jgi:hypothetical protein